MIPIPVLNSVAVITAALLLVSTSTEARAQRVDTPGSGIQQQQNIKAKTRDSGAPRGEANSSGIRFRRNSNDASMIPDTSYSTITNALPNTAKGERVQNREGKADVPESMRIQQETVRALPSRRELITKGPTSVPPTTVNSSVERNRVDSAAPSRQRLQIDDLSAVRPQQAGSEVAATPSINPTVDSLAHGPAAGTTGVTARGRSSGSSGAATHSSHSNSSSSGGGH